MARKEILHPELINLAAKMSPKKLKELSQTVIEEFDEDVASRQGWEYQHKEWAEIYYQTDTSNDPDNEWGSRQSIPLLTEACNQFAARTRKAFFPNREFVTTILSSLGTFPQGMSDEEIAAEAERRFITLRPAAERVRKHMNYQLTVKNNRYKQQKDALFLSVSVHGSVFTKAYWDFQTNQPRVDTVRASDLVVPYSAGPVSIEELPRKTHKLFWTKLKTRMLAESGFFTKECEVASNLQQYIDGPREAADSADKIEPQTDSTETQSSLCFILEQHRYWEVDNLIVPVIVWVDYESEEVVRLAIRYETDDNGNPINERRPIEYFTHYKFLENPDGFYGYGYGHMLGSMNLAINDGMRKSLDAAYLANIGRMSGFISQRLVPQDDAGEEMSLQLGKFTTVPDTVANISDGIKTMDFSGPDPALVQLVQYLDSRGQRLGSVTEASTGQVDKIRQSNALMTELEQALELPSNIHMRLVDSLTDELAKVYRLNRVHLDERVVFVIKDKVEIVSRADYELDAIVTPVFDPKLATMAQRISRAQTELDAVLKNPMSAQDPAVLNAAFRRFYQAIESEDIDELMPQEPQQAQAPEPQRIDDQRVENMLFLMPVAEQPYFDVFADQDHEQHIAIIEEMVNSPYAKELDPEAAEKLKQHRQKHVAYLYGEEVGVDEQSNVGGGKAPMEAADAGMGSAGIDPALLENTDLSIPETGTLGFSRLMGGAAPQGGGTDGA
jgi:hypothetical protein